MRLLIVCELIGLCAAFAPMKTPFMRQSLMMSVEDKLVYDVKNSRLYEADLSKVCVEEEFCLVDAETGDNILLTKEEKERIFLDSIQSYYYSGKSTLPDDQFDRLKEDLSWEGSALVTLNRNETLFLNAMQAYMKGKPLISNKEFDELKASLRDSNSIIAVLSEPKCYVDTGICKATWKPDNLRTSSLYVPAASILTLLYIGAVYEIINPIIAVNPIITLVVGLFPISAATKAITNNIFFENPAVAAGPCPDCGVENRIFFGNVLGVEGDKDEAAIKCTNCKANLTIKRSTLRVSTLMSKNTKAAAPASAS